MSFHRKSGIVAVSALALALVVAGCKSGSQSSTQPAASGASATQPGQPATSASTATGATGAAGTTAAAPAPPMPPQPPPPPPAVTLPVGTDLRVRLDEDLGSKISRPGDSFTATVADDVRRDGTVVIPRGARADGTVVDAKALGRFAGGARLVLRLDRVHSKWGSYPVSTSSIARAEKGKGKRSAGFIGGGAGFGALIGGLAGGGKGAAIGALAGGGAGTAGSAFTGNRQIVLPAETLLTFRLEHPVHIVEQR
jgi:hypothetical protein